MLEMDNWFRPSLDIFDPFDELDNMIGRNLHWLSRPSFMLERKRPRVPEKYRITVNCAGYKPESIKTEVKDNKLVVSGIEEFKDKDSDDFSKKEFKKSYKLPENAEVDKLSSFVAGKHLVVEVPLKQKEAEKIEEEQEDCFPKIVDGENGSRRVKLDTFVPKGIDPSKLSVTCKDRDLIIKAEDKVEGDGTFSQTYFYKHYRLPENTDFNALKCELKDNKLSIQAPLNAAAKHDIQVPIQNAIDS
jgi:HSP20 family molecular chaperone IbpA